MTRDDIISMAREAAARHGHTLKEQPAPETVEFITELAAMAAAAEREACVKACKAQRQLLGENEAKIGGLAIAMCVDAISTRGKK